eukprot:snap_masked-scaffold_28-processed-gene-2.33-mRNA-1 protein AED:1.00 eAED:1.00 QI:0/-1/0/0/-1/1/1/0/146
MKYAKLIKAPLKDVFNIIIRLEKYPSIFPIIKSVNILYESNSKIDAIFNFKLQKFPIEFSLPFTVKHSYKNTSAEIVSKGKTKENKLVKKCILEYTLSKRGKELTLIEVGVEVELINLTHQILFEQGKTKIFTYVIQNYTKYLSNN